MEKIQLTEEEINEGITPEIVDKIGRSGVVSPCQLAPDSEPIKVLECTNGYWQMLSFGVFLKDAKGKLVVHPERDVIVGRARYILAHKTEVSNDEIAREEAHLRYLTECKAKDILSKMSDIMMYAGKKTTDFFEGAIYEMLKTQDPVLFASKEAMAKSVCDESFVALYNKLESLKKKGDYDSLYIILFQNGLPEIASFAYSNEKDMAALIGSFKGDSIQQTMDSIQANGHLTNVAKFNVAKRG